MDEGRKKMWNPPFIEYPNPTAYPDVALSVLSFVPNAYLEIPLLTVKTPQLLPSYTGQHHCNHGTNRKNSTLVQWRVRVATDSI